MRRRALKERDGKRYTRLLFQLTHLNLLVITVCRCSCVMAQIPTFMVRVCACCRRGDTAAVWQTAAGSWPLLR